MPGGRFSKTAFYLSAKLNGNYNGDTVVGGALTTSPGGAGNQGQATLPGDRVIFSPSDALFWSNNNVGNLYTGTYRYVFTANSTSAPTRGHGAFWLDQTGANNSALDGLYEVTSDEAANFGVVQFAGVFVNNFTKTNYWWIQESGKATCAFRNAITAAGAGGAGASIGGGVYLAGAGNNNNAIDVGAFDQLGGANGAATFSAANSNTAYTAIDNMLVRYVGPALTLPANNNVALVDLTLSRASFRW